MVTTKEYQGCYGRDHIAKSFPQGAMIVTKVATKLKNAENSLLWLQPGNKMSEDIGKISSIFLLLVEVNTISSNRLLVEEEILSKFHKFH